MVAIIDYDTGNLRSVLNAINRLGVQCVVTSDPQVIKKASHIILPGVGEASSAMAKLAQRNLDILMPLLTQPVLGICIGMQLMCDYSQEGETKCLGIFPARVMRLNANLSSGIKVPHMGWDTVENLSGPLFNGIKDGSYFYYVHSFAPELCPDTIAVTDYAGLWSGALQKDNFFGTQFHPEKSGEVGERLLQNFLEL